MEVVTPEASQSAITSAFAHWPVWDHILVLESHQVHCLAFQQTARERGFSHVFAPYINCSPALPTASSPGTSQAMRRLKTVQRGVLKRWPGGHRPPLGRKYMSVGESWRRPVRSYKVVSVKIRVDGVSSLLRANDKFRLWWSRETWHQPTTSTPASSANLDWWRINLWAFFLIF